MQRMSKRRRNIILAAIVIAVGFYLVAFHGEQYRSDSPSAGCAVFRETQYFFGITLWTKEWVEPEGRQPGPVEALVPMHRKTWRGFGILWRWTTPYG